jgi:hypothetical protein
VRRRWAISLFAILALITLALWPREKEPHYKGKKLSEWLDDYNNPVAKQAILAIGTNALPFLLEWLRNERPEWHNQLDDLARQTPMFDQSVERADNRRHLLQMNAPYGFKALGALGLPAVPVLTNLFCDLGWNGSGASAGEALAYLKDAWPPVIPLLCDSLTNRNPAVRARAAQTCVFLRENPNAVVPALMLALQDQDASVRWEVTNALQRIAPQVLRTNEVVGDKRQ